MEQLVTEPKEERIRRYFNKEQGKWYFSVVDVIGALTNSADARNYWKVLKSRLKKKDFDLVSKCYRLKMKSKDGKYYLTDTADAETMIKIIEAVPKASVEAFKALIEGVSETISAIAENKIEDKKIEIKESVAEEAGENEEAYEARLLVDAYETSGSIFIRAMLAGVEPGNFFVHVRKDKVVISGKREKIVESSSAIKSYLKEELEWVSFTRTIPLSKPVQVENIKKTEERGLLSIELYKI